MSSPEHLRFWQPLKSVRVAAEAAPVLTEEQIEARVREAYRQGGAEAATALNQQILEQRSEMNHLREQVFRSFEQSAAAAVAEIRAALPVLTMQALRRVLSRVAIGRETVEGVVDELLAEIGPDVGPIEMRLAPADLALVQDLEPQLARVHPGLRFVADETLARGDCQAVTRFGKVDARLRNKLEKLEDSFAPSA